MENAKGKGVQLVGPFIGSNKITIDGYSIPFLTAHDLRKTATVPSDLVELILDDRFSITATRAEVDRWGWFLANAMAVAAGFSSHGEQSQPMNRFRLRLGEFGEQLNEREES